MSIQGKVNELNSIKNELKSLGQRGAALRKRVKYLEGEIEEYLDSKDQPGLKYKGTAIYLDKTSTKRRLKKKSEQRSDVIYVLERHGVESPDKIFDEIMEARRGSPTEKRKLKFKKIGKK